MTKSTATYWNTFAPENKQKWSPIAGLEGTVEELTLSIVQNTGEYTRLTRFLRGQIPQVLAAKAIFTLKKYLS